MADVTIDKCALPTIGATIAPNGATVLKSEHIPDSTDACKVLCLFNGQYVTWLFDIIEENCFWGHYHRDDLAGALIDFERR